MELLYIKTDTWWFELILIWLAISVLIIIALVFQKKKDWKKIGRAVLVLAFLPIIIVGALLAIPFLVFKKKKPVAQKEVPKTKTEKMQDLAGKPGAIIKKYLYPDRHMK